MVYVAPDVEAVMEYLGDDNTHPGYVVEEALNAEAVAQLHGVRMPREADPAVAKPYPADLAEALCRRVMHNLELRSLPLGLQASVAEGAVTTNYVGGTDAEVRRLEKPYRRLTVG